MFVSLEMNIPTYMHYKLIRYKMKDTELIQIIEANDLEKYIDILKSGFEIINDNPPICDSSNCKGKNRSMVWRSKTNSNDKYTWKYNAMHCGTTKSIREGSFWSFYKHCLNIIL